jgi:putative nucleotidyltransferase with HDIG domain
MFLGLPRRAGLFWLLVVTAATVVVAASWLNAFPDLSLAPAALFFAVACGIGERVQVRLSSSRPGGDVMYSVSCGVLVAAILLFPLAWAIFIAAVGLALGGALRGQRQPIKLLFNMANLTLSVAAGSALWSLGGGAAGLTSPASIPLIVIAALTYFAINTSLTAAIVAFVLHLPIRLVWRRSHGNMMTANLAMLAVGVPAAGLWLAYPWMLVCLAIALWAVHGAMSDRVKLETQTLDSLFELADILDARDKYTHGHSERVGHYAEQLAVQLELAGDRTHLAFLAGRLHDIGKCAIDNEVLLKPGALAESERDQMRRHPEVGSAMLAHFSLFRDVARSVRGHHERWDGQGYPDGLLGEAIPLEARIIAVADSYDAMTTTRPYRVALPHAEAIRRLHAGAGQQWDPKIVSAFVKWAELNQAPTVAAPLAPLETSAA